MSTLKSIRQQETGLKRHLFHETSHSPSLIDLVGEHKGNLRVWEAFARAVHQKFRQEQ